MAAAWGLGTPFYECPSMGRTTMGRRFGIPRRLSRSINRRFLGLFAAYGPTSIITLETRGRRSGRPHRVILPVYSEGPHRMFVVSSYGGHSDWFRNVQANPSVRVLRGRQAYEGKARVVTLREFRRALKGPQNHPSPSPSWLAPFVRLAFLVRARISRVVVEVET